MIWFSSLRKPFYAVVHARARIGNNFKRPALPGAIQFQSLLLPFQIDFLVVTGYAGISDCLALNVVSCVKQVRPQLRQIKSSVTAAVIKPGQQREPWHVAFKRVGLPPAARYDEVGSG